MLELYLNLTMYACMYTWKKYVKITTNIRYNEQSCLLA